MQPLGCCKVNIDECFACLTSAAHLAGGELQRFAIAVVAAQEADVYMIDEPSSYLDVRQRLKAAQASQAGHLVSLNSSKCSRS